jgi:hypothetical protein
MNLPIVNPGIAASIQSELSDKFDKTYIREQVARLEKENPVIAHWIKRYSSTTKDKLGSAYCAIILYRLLESQLECDEMSKTINLG